MVLSYRDVFDIFKQKSFDSKKSVEAALTAILSDGNFDDDNLSSSEIAKQRARLSNLFYKMKTKWYGNKVRHIMEKMEEKNMLPKAPHWLKKKKNSENHQCRSQVLNISIRNKA